MTMHTIKQSARLAGRCVWVAALALGLVSAAHAADITGAGATFPYPIYAKWASEYKKASGVGLNYQSVGSGAGIKQIIAKTVDFGASDMPLPDDRLEKEGLFQFPAVIGGVMPVVNLPQVQPGQLRLTGALLADIYLGKIKQWNDAAIKQLNPGVALPDKTITVVVRSDGSGTTFLFTNYLSKVSSDWKSKVGEGTAVKWPDSVGGKGNEGVANYVKTLANSIGYVEYAYAKQNKLIHVSLQNLDGKYVEPDDMTFKAAAAKADWTKSKGMGLILTQQPGATAWPITGASFVLMHRLQDKPETARAVLAFFNWAFANGDKAAEELDYVPMPDTVVKQVQNHWRHALKDSSGKAIAP